MTLSFTVAESIAPPVVALPGATNGDTSGNRVIDRKSLPFNDIRLEKSPEFVLHR